MESALHFLHVLLELTRKKRVCHLIQFVNICPHRRQRQWNDASDTCTTTSKIHLCLTAVKKSGIPKTRWPSGEVTCQKGDFDKCRAVSTHSRLFSGNDQKKNQKKNHQTVRKKDIFLALFSVLKMHLIVLY